MDKRKLALLKELQNGFKLENRPFKRMAKELGYTEEDVLKIISSCMESGVIRRIGLAVKPERLGHTNNALVAWEVPEDRVEEVGTALAARKEISHCYDRECPPGWEYNLFTMIHAKSPEGFDDILASIQDSLGLKNFQVFKTIKELKKTSMRYFEDVALEEALEDKV